MPARQRLLLLTRTALLAGGAAVAGCHHMEAPAVPYPPPPLLVCPPLCSAVADEGTGPVSLYETASTTGEPQPIDLPTALRLANVQNPEIALARERIREALAIQDRAEMLWLPDVAFGTNWTRHDGQIQRAVGDVFTTSRSALFVGGGPVLSVDLSEALYAPLAARQFTEARRAGAAAVANERLLDVALAYLDLLQVHADQQIIDEAYRHARHMVEVTESHEKAGTGRAADTARARTELNIRARERLELEGRAAVASAQLARLLFLAPEQPLRPIEPAVVPVRIVPESLSLTDLVAQALSGRPELAESQALIGATLARWRAARVAPLVPKLQVGYSAGGFGGGINGFFGDFNGRGDAVALAQWELSNLGLGNHAVTRERYSRYAQAVFSQHGVASEVATQVVAAYNRADVARRELTVAQEAVQAARESYRQNERGVRDAPAQFRPIELLQALQALARARQDYLRVVIEYNRAQFRLYTALGNPPLCALENTANVPISEPTVPPAPTATEPAPRPVPGEPAKLQPE